MTKRTKEEAEKLREYSILLNQPNTVNIEAEETTNSDSKESESKGK